MDEAHERTVQTDVLFGIVKKAQTNRIEGNFHPLKVKYFFLFVCGDFIILLTAIVIVLTIVLLNWKLITKQIKH